MLKKKVDLDEDILSKVSDYDIYTYYFGNFIVGKAYLSPFRNDKSPSFSIRAGDNFLYHIDYAYPDDYKGNCISFVKQLYGFSYREAVDRIYEDIILSGVKPKVIKRKIEKTEKVIIIPTLKDFTREELLWWLQYGITQEDLVKDNVFSVESYKTGEWEGFVEKGEMCFGYRYDAGWKLYFPNRIKEKKWKSSIPNSTVEGWDNVKDLSRIIVTKSKKDRLVLQKILPNVINVQNESKSFLTEENVGILQHFKELYIWYDADEVGVRACTDITTEHKWKYINTPKRLVKVGVKDPSDWLKYSGNDLPLREFLKKKKLL